MMRARELKQWLNALKETDEIAVDDGGLTLVVRYSRVYCEVGGIPLADDGKFDDDYERGWRNA